MRPTTGYRAVRDHDPAATGVARWDFERRDLRPDDLAVRVTHCGVCHTDLHALHAWSDGDPSLVPGHELVGTVAAVGDAVTGFAAGDLVAVGNIVDSCGRCAMCLAGQENFCAEFPTLTYGGRDRHDAGTTLGGWSSEIIVRDRFTYRVPAGLDPAAVAPLLCAGITVWEPLRAWGVGPGTELAVVGLGGLGHLAVKLGHALGATVTVLTTSSDKAPDATVLGADHVVVTTDDEALAAVRDRFDLVLDCVPVAHDLAPYLRTVALDGTLCTLGHLGPASVDVLDLLVGRKRLSSAGSGGTPRTQELLDFCGDHGIVADVEVLPSAQVGDALARLAAGDVRYRFVLDLGDLGDVGD